MCLPLKVDVWRYRVPSIHGLLSCIPSFFGVSGWEGQSKGAIAKAAAASTLTDAGDAEEQSKKVEAAERRQSAAAASLAMDIEQARRMNEIEEAATDDAKEREERVEA